MVDRKYYCPYCDVYSKVRYCSKCGNSITPSGILDKNDPVNSPAHYKDRVPGIEAIEVTENFNFNVGNALKYLWRHGMKGDPIQDLEKSVWYIKREIKRLRKGGK